MIRASIVAVALALSVVGCGGAPNAASVRDSFAQQLAANTFVSEFQRNGNELTFKGPRPDGAPGRWRVLIDSAVVSAQADQRQPYKGTVTSSWSVDGEDVKVTGADSNLPIELLANGISQDCWAFWDAATKRWSWE